MKRLYTLYILLIALVLASCGSTGKSSASVSQEELTVAQDGDDRLVEDDESRPAPESTNDSEGMTNADGKVIVIDFFATWCGPCKQLAPIMERMEEKYGNKLTFTKIDVDEQPQMAQQFAIEGVPTIVVVSPQGEVLHKLVGLQPEENYESVFSSL